MLSAEKNERIKMKSKNKTLKRIFTVIAVLLIVAGVCVALFPQVSNAVYEKNVDAMEQEFASQSGDKYDELFAELTKRNEEMFASGQSGLEDPFSYEDSDIDLTKYGIKDGVIGFVYIPKMDVKLPIVFGASKENLLKGAAHMTNTSYPIGGNNTNSVLAAHRGWNRAKMFRHIELLEVGDKVYVENFREKLTYKVAKIEIIYPDDVDKLKIQPDKDMLTLITCHPYRVNNRRYVVYCEADCR